MHENSCIDSAATVALHKPQNVVTGCSCITASSLATVKISWLTHSPPLLFDKLNSKTMPSFQAYEYISLTCLLVKFVERDNLHEATLVVQCHWNNVTLSLEFISLAHHWLYSQAKCSMCKATLTLWIRTTRQPSKKVHTSVNMRVTRTRLSSCLIKLERSQHVTKGHRCHGTCRLQKAEYAGRHNIKPHHSASCFQAIKKFRALQVSMFCKLLQQSV